jgi:hypothetical protein
MKKFAEAFPHEEIVATLTHELSDFPTACINWTMANEKDATRAMLTWRSSPAQG